MKKLKIVVMMGLPGSGKTTEALKMVVDHPSEYKRINKDELRNMLDGGKWSKANEKFIVHIRDEFIFQALEWGYSVIVDDTNLYPEHLKSFYETADSFDNVTVEIKDFTNVTPEECVKRDLKRDRSVGKDVIMDMYNKYLKPKAEPVVQNSDLPDAYQYDLDGTLALYDNPDNIRSLNYDREFIYDRPNYAVLDQLRMQQKAGYKILILSGRNGEHEAVTKEWFKKYDINPDLFVMRKVGDRRKDFEVKEEMFREHVLPKYHVEAIYDDRDQVVKLWRSMGLVCFQVAEGNF